MTIFGGTIYTIQYIFIPSLLPPFLPFLFCLPACLPSFLVSFRPSFLPSANYLLIQLYFVVDPNFLMQIQLLLIPIPADEVIPTLTPYTLALHKNQESSSGRPAAGPSSPTPSWTPRTSRSLQVRSGRQARVSVGGVMSQRASDSDFQCCAVKALGFATPSSWAYLLSSYLQVFNARVCRKPK